MKHWTEQEREKSKNKINHGIMLHTHNFHLIIIPFFRWVFFLFFLHLFALIYRNSSKSLSSFLKHHTAIFLQRITWNNTQKSLILKCSLLLDVVKFIDFSRYFRSLAFFARFPFWSRSNLSRLQLQLNSIDCNCIHGCLGHSLQSISSLIKCIIQILLRMKK